MKIDPGSDVAGIPILTIRDFLRRIGDDAWTVRWMLKELDVEQDVALAALEELEVQGFVKRRSEKEWFEEHVVVQGAISPPENRHASNAPAWATTIKGNALRMASAAPSAKRGTADRVLAEFLQRVREVKESSSHLYRVKWVILFGSMLDESKERVNDIDLVVNLVRKVKDKDRAHELDREYADSRVQEGRRFSTYTDYLFAAQTDTLKFLRKRSRLLNFHRIDGEVWQETPHRVIYRDPDERE